LDAMLLVGHVLAPPGDLRLLKNKSKSSFMLSCEAHIPTGSGNERAICRGKSEAAIVNQSAICR
jgi:hypothetical protein